jgi:hypothetical protein
MCCMGRGGISYTMAETASVPRRQLVKKFVRQFYIQKYLVAIKLCSNC